MQGEKSSASGLTPARVRPLREPITIYIDNSRESKDAQRLLNESGVLFVATQGPVEPLNRKPLAIYLGGVYQGLDEISGLRDLLAFWSDQRPLIAHDELFSE